MKPLRPRRRRPVPWPLCLAGLLVTACGGDDPSTPPSPVPGTAIVTLGGATAEDRAVLLDIGSEATSVSAGTDGIQVRSRSVDGGWAVAAFGALAGGEIVRVAVADTTSLPAVVIRQVAVTSGDLRESLATYRGEVDVVR